MLRKMNIATLALILSVSCKKPMPEPEGYQVVSYDGRTHEWTIIQTGTFDGKLIKKRLVVQCESYQWGNHPHVDGLEACHLVVGRLMVPNSFMQDRKGPLLDIFEMPDEVLSITEGDGDNRVMQQFKILKNEVVGGQ